MMTDDPTLLRRFAEDHREEDFAELVNRHLGLVYRTALRRTNGDSHLAEDITQQVFAALAREAAKVQKHPLIEGWLYLTTRHAAAATMRIEQRRRLREQEAYAMNQFEPHSDANHDWDRIRPELDQVMDALPEHDRHAVLLRYFSNQPFARIGEVLQISENAARMRVDRALDRLRSLLEKRGIASTSAALASLLANQAVGAVPNGLASTITTASLLGATTAPATVGVIAFMSTTKMLAIIGALTCAATSFLLSEFRGVVGLRGFCAAEQQKHETLAHELSRTRSETAVAQDRLAKTNEQISALRNQANLAMQQREANPSAFNSADPTVLMLHHPEYQQLWLQRRKTNLGVEYARLYKTLGLTPQQVSDFENAQMETQKAGLDLWASIHDQTGRTEAYNDRIYYPLRTELSQQLDAKLRQIIGDTGMVVYKQYEVEMRFARTTSPVIHPFVYDLFYTQTPLSVSQANQLNALITTSTVSSGESRVSLDWLKILDQSQNFLSPKQTEVFKVEMGRVRLATDINELRKKLSRKTP